MSEMGWLLELVFGVVVDDNGRPDVVVGYSATIHGLLGCIARIPGLLL